MTAVDGGSTATYVYNALNQRVRTVVGSTATEFVFNAAGQRASVWNGTTHAQLQGQYYWGGKPVAYYANGSAQFQHQDWLGTERLRTTYNGGVEGTFTSLPFGDGLTTASGTDTDAYHYATLDHDYETDIDHAQFRQYSDAQGHWMSPDPYGGSYDSTNPQSMNRYAYVQNDPLSFVDPEGTNIDTCGGNPLGCPAGYNGSGGGGLWGDPTPGFGEGLLQAFGGDGIFSELDSIDTPVDGTYISPVNGLPYLAINGIFYAPNGDELGPSSMQELGLSVIYVGLIGGEFMQASNNGECDNACQLAHAFNKTGVYTLTSPCFVPAFYAASGTAAAGGVAVANYAEIEAATAGNYATWYGRAISWLNRVVGRTPLGPPVSAMAATAAGQVSQFCNSH